MAPGGVCVYTHIVGPQVKQMIGAFKAGETARAKEIDDSLRPLIDTLAVTTNPIPVKTALELLGHDVGPLRLPLVAATEHERTRIQDGLVDAGLLSAP